MSKECFKCNRTLPLSEFYRHPQMADGTLGKCKECTRLDARQNRLKRLDKYRAYDRDRNQREDRKAMRKTYLRHQRCENPQKSKARAMAARAAKDGRITREPCYFCGSAENLEMHHPNYEYPLKVYWLCRQCHRRLDNMNKLEPARAQD